MDSIECPSENSKWARAVERQIKKMEKQKCRKVMAWGPKPMKDGTWGFWTIWEPKSWKEGN